MLNSIHGIGKVYSAGILAELGSIKAFQNANQLAKYCGIVWNDNDSGDFGSEDSRMSKAGNRYLRYYRLCEIFSVKQDLKGSSMIK